MSRTRLDRLVYLAGFSSLFLLSLFYMMSRLQVDKDTIYPVDLDYLEDKTTEISILGNKI